MAPRFELSWELTVAAERADQLEAALAPETDPEHAELASTDRSLTVTGTGDAGTSLHTLDDVLACLTGALEALDAAGPR